MPCALYLSCLSLSLLITMAAQASLQWQHHAIDDEAGQKVVKYLGQQLNHDRLQPAINISVAYIKLSHRRHQTTEPLMIELPYLFLDGWQTQDYNARFTPNLPSYLNQSLATNEARHILGGQTDQWRNYQPYMLGQALDEGDQDSYYQQLQQHFDQEKLGFLDQLTHKTNLLTSTLAALFLIKTELPLLRQQLAKLNFSSESALQFNTELQVINYLKPTPICYDAQTVLPWLEGVKIQFKTVQTERKRTSIDNLGNDQMIKKLRSNNMMNTLSSPNLTPFYHQSTVTVSKSLPLPALDLNNNNPTLIKLYPGSEPKSSIVIPTQVLNSVKKLGSLQLSEAYKPNGAALSALSLDTHLKPPVTIWGITNTQVEELFTQSTDLVCLSNAHHWTRMNKRWTEVFGWSEQEFLSHSLFYHIHPEDRIKTFAAAQTGTTNACMIDFENRYRCKDGSYRYLRWFTLLQASGANQNQPMLAIARDMTSQHEAEAQSRSLTKAQAESQAKSNFVAHMSHEIRTPLNSILGFLQLAIEEEQSPAIKGYLNYAQGSANSLLNIANDILDLSRIEANALKIENVLFQPRATVQKVIDTFGASAYKKGVQLKSIVHNALPYNLLGDEARLEQILFNLIGNALKFTAQGSISLSLNGILQDRQPASFTLTATVVDTGIGMQPELMERLFTPFAQSSEIGARKYGGTGLGLYITKQLCEKMGGHIHVTSQPTMGSSFQFTLPFDLSADGDATTSSSTVPIHQQLPPLHVLIAEDNAVNQKLLTVMLNKLGCKVALVDNGQQAIDQVQVGHYDLVLMDGEMPIMDGLNATRVIRQSLSSHQLPIIGVSAHAMLTHRQEFLMAGMDGYVTKPIKKTDLIKEIVTCLHKLGKLPVAYHSFPG